MSSIVSGQHSGFGTGSGAGSGNFDLLRRATHAVMSCYNPTRLHTKSPNAKQAQGTSQKGIKKKFGQWKPVDAAGYSALVKNSRDLRSG
ncbi:hypothetical protein MGG_15654 [Pyricularia oryzae 70-15]|uniref:Uncharacterized protein n=2 Tax=Pyricularia oryzae TaxID=318829 RepID=G4MXM1_PYRO7|nr:uncharacterized protein MGG_15654 [Pyricularia oryzae 70-15]EHA54352.1 hypothetical protein MGG_15654 [Pyricularia oryzae 70-15]